MYALIRAGGRQHRVTNGDLLRIDRQPVEVGNNIKFDEVLMVRHGDETVIGEPLVADAHVQGKVVRHDRDKKITVFKFKRRKGYSKKIGHRQDFTEVLIDSVMLGGKALEPDEVPEEEPVKSKPKKKAAPKATKQKVVEAKADEPAAEAKAEAEEAPAEVEPEKTEEAEGESDEEKKED